jgi:acetoin:2,6-dichlorophenolindophenol oxidoreductase subunit beta
MAETTYLEAIGQALREEMDRDPAVVLLGEDVGVYGGAFKATAGLLERFGWERVIDTPISETAIIGAAIGMGYAGLRPVAEMQFMDFIACCFNQITNFAAKSHYRWGAPVPIVVRGPVGGGVHGGAFHSANPEMYFVHTPGLKVVCPGTAYDAKGLLKSAIRDENPVVFFEDKMMFRLKGPVPAEDYTVPLGVADIKREGNDMTIVATSSMVQVALGAAKLLEEYDISAEVIDPRTLWPLDENTLIESARKTSRVIVLDEGYERYGATAEIASVIAEGAFFDLEAPVKRMGAMHVPIPFSPPLEDATVPTEKAVFEAARAMVGKN